MFWAQETIQTKVLRQEGNTVSEAPRLNKKKYSYVQSTGTISLGNTLNNAISEISASRNPAQVREVLKMHVGGCMSMLISSPFGTVRMGTPGMGHMTGLAQSSQAAHTVEVGQSLMKTG